MKRIVLIVTLFLSATMMLNAQAKKPTIMVVPSDV